MKFVIQKRKYKPQAYKHRNDDDYFYNFWHCFYDCSYTHNLIISINFLICKMMLRRPRPRPRRLQSPRSATLHFVQQTRSAQRNKPSSAPRNQKENPTINVGINLQIIKAKSDYFAGFSTGAFGPFGGNGIIGSN